MSAADGYFLCGKCQHQWCLCGTCHAARHDALAQELETAKARAKRWKISAISGRLARRQVSRLMEFARWVETYASDTDGLVFERLLAKAREALSDEPAPKNDPWSEPCDMCHKQATWSHREQGKPPIRRCEAHRDAKSLGRLSTPTTEGEPKRTKYVGKWEEPYGPENCENCGMAQFHHLCPEPDK
jgi:hypothetical protein